MVLEYKNKKIPEEFKKLSEDFTKDGFITTSLDNLINWVFVQMHLCLMD